MFKGFAHQAISNDSTCAQGRQLQGDNPSSSPLVGSPGYRSTPARRSAGRNGECTFADHDANEPAFVKVITALLSPTPWPRCWRAIRPRPQGHGDVRLV